MKCSIKLKSEGLQFKVENTNGVVRFKIIPGVIPNSFRIAIKELGDDGYGFHNVKIVKNRPYQILLSSQTNIIPHRIIHLLFLTAYLATDDIKENPIIKLLASQIQTCFQFITTDDRSYKVAIGEFGFIIKYVPEDKHLAARASFPILFQFAQVYESQGLQLLQIDNDAAIAFKIGHPLNDEDTNEILQDIYKVAAQIVHHREYHMLDANYHLGRTIITSLATASHQKTYYPGSYFNPGIIAGCALLSSFSMADASSTEPYHLTMQILGMMGGAVFNFLGGSAFTGFSREHWFSILGGLLSAISPAVMTMFGIKGIVKPEIFAIVFGFICALANLLLSAALGTEGMQEISGVVRDFFWSSNSKFLAIFEIVICSIFACYLSLARIQASMKIMLCGPVDEHCVANTDSHSAASYWSVTLLSTLCNVPEALMFLTSYLKTRKKVVGAMRTHNYPADWGHKVSHGVALVLAVSFFTIFKAVGNANWAESFDEWFDPVEGPLAGLVRTDTGSVVTPGDMIGSAAFLLAASTGNSVHAMATALYYGVPTAARATAAKTANVWNAIARRLRSTPEERQPLLGADDVPNVVTQS